MYYCRVISGWQIPRHFVLQGGPLQLYSTKHTTAQHKAIIPTPNPTTAQQCQPGTLCDHRELCSHTFVARLYPFYPVFMCWFKMISRFSKTCTSVLYVGQSTTSGLPHESRRIFRALNISLARGHARLWCCDFSFYGQRHIPTTINRLQARISYIDFYIDSLLKFFLVS